MIRLAVATLCVCVPCSTWVDLFLLRHGIAEPRIDGRDHPDRALTPRGLQRTQHVVETLARIGFQAERLISSPYARALETAWLAHRAGLAPEPEQSLCLMPGGRHQSVLSFAEQSCLLVGHEPDLSGLAEALIGAPAGTLQLRKAGFMHLRRPVDGDWLAGAVRLELLLRPSVLEASGVLEG